MRAHHRNPINEFIMIPPNESHYDFPLLEAYVLIISFYFVMLSIILFIDHKYKPLLRFKSKQSSLEYSFIAARNFQVIIAFYCIIRLNITIWQYIRISNENFFAQRNFGAKTVIFDSSWFTDVHLVKEKYKLSKQYTVSKLLGILFRISTNYKRLKNYIT